MSLTDSSGVRDQGSGVSKVLVLLDDKPGHANQALGVAEKLGLPFEAIKLEYSIFSKLPNLLLGRSLFGLNKKSKWQVASGKWQKDKMVVISCGRRTAPVARWLKKNLATSHLPLATKFIHIMNPEAGLEEFDLIALPAHDRLVASNQGPGANKNIYRLVTAPHRITEEKLQAEAERWKEKFAELKKPIIGVLVGGGTKSGKFSKHEVEKFGQLLSDFTEKSGGSLVVVTSRRTGREAEAWLCASVTSGKWQVASKEKSANCELHTAYYPYNESIPNPYLATIALADVLVVTGDSVSMVSEACYSGKPVLVYSDLAAVSDKHKLFLQNLYRLDMVQPFDGNTTLTSSQNVTKSYDSAKELASYVTKNLY